MTSVQQEDALAVLASITDISTAATKIVDVVNESVEPDLKATTGEVLDAANRIQRAAADLSTVIRRILKAGDPPAIEPN